MPFPDENEFVLPDGITLNGDRDADGVLVTCATLDGWGSPGSTGGGRQKDGAHGESPAPNPKLQARVLQLTGRIDAPSKILRQQMEHRLEAALGLDLFDLTVLDAIPLTVQAQRSAAISVVDDTDQASTWQAELKCPDPRRYGGTESLDIPLPEQSGGVRFPLRFPLRFTGGTETGERTATNNGNFTADTYARLNGPLTSPLLANLRTGQTVTYNDTLASGEYVDLYLTTPMLALLMGTANRSGRISTSGGGPFGLLKGDNPIAFRAAGGTGTAHLEWKHTYG